MGLPPQVCLCVDGQGAAFKGTSGVLFIPSEEVHSSSCASFCPPQASPLSAEATQLLVLTTRHHDIVSLQFVWSSSPYHLPNFFGEDSKSSEYPKEQANTQSDSGATKGLCDAEPNSSISMEPIFEDVPFRHVDLRFDRVRFTTQDDSSSPPPTKQADRSDESAIKPAAHPFRRDPANEVPLVASNVQSDHLCRDVSVSQDDNDNNDDFVLHFEEASPSRTSTPSDHNPAALLPSLSPQSPLENSSASPAIPPGRRVLRLALTTPKSNTGPFQVQKASKVEETKDSSLLALLRGDAKPTAPEATEENAKPKEKGGVACDAGSSPPDAAPSACKGAGRWMEGCEVRGVLLPLPTRPAYAERDDAAENEIPPTAFESNPKQLLNGATRVLCGWLLKFEPQSNEEENDEEVRSGVRSSMLISSYYPDVHPHREATTSFSILLCHSRRSAWWCPLVCRQAHATESVEAGRVVLSITALPPEEAVVMWPLVYQDRSSYLTNEASASILSLHSLPCRVSELRAAILANPVMHLVDKGIDGCGRARCASNCISEEEKESRHEEDLCPFILEDRVPAINTLAPREFSIANGSWRVKAHLNYLEAFTDPSHANGLTTSPFRFYFFDCDFTYCIESLNSWLYTELKACQWALANPGSPKYEDRAVAAACILVVITRQTNSALSIRRGAWATSQVIVFSAALIEAGMPSERRRPEWAISWLAPTRACVSVVAAVCEQQLRMLSQLTDSASAHSSRKLLAEVQTYDNAISSLAHAYALSQVHHKEAERVVDLVNMEEKLILRLLWSLHTSDHGWYTAADVEVSFFDGDITLQLLRDYLRRLMGALWLHGNPAVRHTLNSATSGVLRRLYFELLGPFGLLPSFPWAAGKPLGGMSIPHHSRDFSALLQSSPTALPLAFLSPTSPIGRILPLRHVGRTCSGLFFSFMRGEVDVSISQSENAKGFFDLTLRWKSISKPMAEGQQALFEALMNAFPADAMVELYFIFFVFAAPSWAGGFLVGGDRVTERVSLRQSTPLRWSLPLLSLRKGHSLRSKLRVENAFYTTQAIQAPLDAGLTGGGKPKAPALTETSPRRRKLPHRRRRPRGNFSDSEESLPEEPATMGESDELVLDLRGGLCQRPRREAAAGNPVTEGLLPLLVLDEVETGVSAQEVGVVYEAGGGLWGHCRGVEGRLTPGERAALPEGLVLHLAAVSTAAELSLFSFTSTAQREAVARILEEEGGGEVGGGYCRDDVMGKTLLAWADARIRCAYRTLLRQFVREGVAQGCQGNETQHGNNALDSHVDSFPQACQGSLHERGGEETLDSIRRAFCQDRICEEMQVVLGALEGCVRAAIVRIPPSPLLASLRACLEGCVCTFEHVAHKDLSLVQRTLALHVIGAADFLRRATPMERRILCTMFKLPDALNLWLRDTAARCGCPEESITLASVLHSVQERISSSKDYNPSTVVSTKEVCMETKKRALDLSSVSPRTKSDEGLRPTRVLSLKGRELKGELQDLLSPVRSRTHNDYEMQKKGGHVDGRTLLWRSASDLLRTCLGLTSLPVSSPHAGTIDGGRMTLAARSLSFPAQLAAAIEAEDSNVS